MFGKIANYFLNLDGLLVACDKCLETFHGALKIALDGAFPDGGDAKTLQRKFPVRLDVANDVVVELVVPEISVAFGTAGELAAMLVPKTPVDENGHAVLEEENIGGAR